MCGHFISQDTGHQFLLQFVSVPYLRHRPSILTAISECPLPDSGTQYSYPRSTPHCSCTGFHCGSRGEAASAHWPVLCSPRSERGECSCECPVSHGTTYGDPQGLANERAGATDHFPDAVLERGHDGAQAPEFQDHAG